MTPRDIAARLRAGLKSVPEMAERLADGEGVTGRERTAAVSAYRCGGYQAAIEMAISDLERLARHETATKRVKQRESARVRRETKLATEKPAAFAVSAELAASLAGQDGE